MTTYRNRETESVLTLAELREALPNVFVPEDAMPQYLDGLGYDVVKFIPPHGVAPGPTQRAVRDGIELVNGQWQDKWVVVDLVGQELAERLAYMAAEVQAQVVTAVQVRLDDFARTRNYDGILSVCTYATSAVPKFAAEGQAAVNLRDATWATLYGILAQVQAGTRAMPSSFADIETELPALSWPE